ncbi:MAG: phosphoribosylamine--glycine ligase [Omnitrophica bacterium RIFCSPHIGHO2_02_FULL_63_14]|nr:MAG: phosphoribosylamine--glycine ligase [Omnitrophica bacterium RIFCSPHIGHO2_02_FULL_63_14]
MKVLVIGSGGREHAISWKLAQSKKLTKLYAAPGNAGMAHLAQIVDIAAKDQEGLLRFCKKEAIDLVIVGPEAPLVEGIVDRFEKEGVRIFGPSKHAAQIEGSKIFAKRLMKKLGIPTGDFETFEEAGKAMDYVAKRGVPIVIKADGLAGGKGVVVAQSMPKAMEAIHLHMVKKIFGKASERIVVEECLEGDEASVIAVTDGVSVRLLASCQDHKRINEGDTGPNTGGMGAYSPAPIVTPELEKEITEKVFLPIVNDFKAAGQPFKGFLYAGIMITAQGWRVLEFNVRLGDPEAQVILPRMENDLLDVALAVVEGRLSDLKFSWKDQHSVCVVIASGGYPEDFQTGKRIAGIASAEEEPGIVVFHAGTKEAGGQLVTAGGRVLDVVGLGSGIFEALSKTYRATEKIFFERMYYRKDIGHKAARVFHS